MQTTTTIVAGADGSQQATTTLGWFDSQINEPCAMMVAADGRSRCLPSKFIYDSRAFFADSECKKPVVMIANTPPKLCDAFVGSTPPVPNYINAQPLNCQSGSRIVRRLGEKLSLSNIYVNEACVQTPASGFDVYDASGPDIPPTEFVELTTTITTSP